MLVFTEDWIRDLHRKYRSQPKYQRPFIYYLATFEGHESRRNEIETWVSQLPAPKRTDIIERLRRDGSYTEAFNELAVGASLRHLGFETEYSPRLGNLTPDWLAKARNDVPEFVVEVVSVRAPKDRQTASLRTNWIMDAIHDIPINAILNTHQVGNQELPYGSDVERMSHAVHEWLATTGPAAGDTFEYAGLRFEMLGHEPSSSHAWCLGPGGSFVVSDESLKRNVELKVKKCADEVTKRELAFVVAVVADFLTGLTFDHFTDVLVGGRVVRYGSDKQGNFWSYPGRDYHGVLTRASKSEALSAGLLVTLQAVEAFQHQAFHNAHAAHPLPETAFVGETGTM